MNMFIFTILFLIEYKLTYVLLKISDKKYDF